MELRHLRYFITVAEELNFSRAALKLFTAQPSLSQQIKDLEEDVGVQLLFRTKRKVELTEEGSVFLEQARLTLAQADKAIAMARQIARSKQQLLRIGFVPIAEIQVFPHILPNLRIHHADLKIELSSLNNTEQLRALNKGELDITFTRNNINDDTIESKFVLHEPLVFVLSQHHPLAKYHRIPLQALNGTDIILPIEEQTSVLTQSILAFAEQYGVRCNTLVQPDDILLNIQSVQQNIGCAIVPAYITSFPMENMVIRHLEVELPHIALYVNYRKNSNSTMVKEFIELLEKKFRDK